METVNSFFFFIQVILVGIPVIGILIFVHELGHFLLAKTCGVGVIEFAIGFGRVIFQRRWHGTKYSIRLFPLGGFVKMAGDDIRQLHGIEIEEEQDFEKKEPDPEEAAMQADESQWFLKKRFWPKFAIVVAGPGFNIIFAILCSIFSFTLYGKVVPINEAVIGAVIPDFPADKAGIKPGDKILAINDKEVSDWDTMAEMIGASGGQELKLNILRGEPAEEILIFLSGTGNTAELDVLEGGDSKERFKIGIRPDVKREAVNPGEAVILGGNYIFYLSAVVVRGLSAMVVGLISPKNIAGPIFIFKEAANSAKRGLEHLLDFMIFLSVSLAVLNLLPIPILDGGHLMFFIIEALKGSPVSLKLHEVANQLGMAILLLLMLFAIGNDLFRELFS